MAKRNVLKPFKLNTPEGIIDFAAGTQKIDDKYLDHWFVQAHLEQPEDEAEEEPEEDEAAERQRLFAELASFGINVGGNIKLDTLRDRVAKARADAENPAE